MFILYAVPIGLALGFLFGGRLGGLATIEFRWPWLAIAGFLVQVLLFSEAVSSVVGSAGPPIYVASTAAVLVAVLRNVFVPGLAVVALGAASNLLAIVSNGGFMPASEDAFASLGRSVDARYSNSAIMASPGFEPLTDVYAMPAWMPFANVFSIGDVLIAVGVVIVLVAGMRVRVTSSASDGIAPGVEAEAPVDAVRAP